MPIQISDLPPWAQEQALKKMQEQDRSKDKPTAQPTGQSASKYHNERDQRIAAGGSTLKFDSKKEARRFDELHALLLAGKIRDLKLQPQFTLQEAYTTPDGKRVRAIRYHADFSYEQSGEPNQFRPYRWVRVVEDVKSKATKTQVYEIKKKLLQERLGIGITEV